MRKIAIHSYMQIRQHMNTFKKRFARDRIAKFKKIRASGWVVWRLFDIKEYIFLSKMAYLVLL